MTDLVQMTELEKFVKALERELSERYYGRNWNVASPNDMFLAILNSVSGAIGETLMEEK